MWIFGVIKNNHIEDGYMGMICASSVLGMSDKNRRKDCSQKFIVGGDVQSLQGSLAPKPIIHEQLPD